MHRHVPFDIWFKHISFKNFVMRSCNAFTSLSTILKIELSAYKKKIAVKIRSASKRDHVTDVLYKLLQVLYKRPPLSGSNLFSNYFVLELAFSGKGGIFRLI